MRLTRRTSSMELKYPAAPLTRYESLRKCSNSDVGIKVEKGKFVRKLGRAMRSYGQVQLKCDPSEFLNPMEEMDSDPDSLARTKLKLFHNLYDLATTKKGCVVSYTLEYFGSSNNVVQYVEALVAFCLTSDYVMEVTTKHFLLISNIVMFGESIKREMFNTLKHMHEDLLSFGLTDGLTNLWLIINPQLLLKYYDHDITCRYYKFVSLLFFRFRKHLDSYRRYSILAKPTLSGLSYLLREGSLQSLKLFTQLAQLNFHALGKWFCDDLMQLVDNVIRERYRYRANEVKRNWLSGSLDIIYEGPIMNQNVYDRYRELLGEDWVKHVVYPPVQVLQRMNNFVMKDKFDYFHINDDDIIRNMYVYLP